MDPFLGGELWKGWKNTPKQLKNQDKWARNIRKNLKLQGKEYIGAQGIKKPKAGLKPPCKSGCSRKCEIPYEKRLEIFNSYYALANYERQRYFIQNNIEKEVKKPNLLNLLVKGISV